MHALLAVTRGAMHLRCAHQSCVRLRNTVCTFQELPDKVLPVILLCPELHPELCCFLLSQPVHGVQLAGYLLGVCKLLSQRPLMDSQHTAKQSPCMRMAQSLLLEHAACPLLFCMPCKVEGHLGQSSTHVEQPYRMAAGTEYTCESGAGSLG